MNARRFPFGDASAPPSETTQMTAPLPPSQALQTAPLPPVQALQTAPLESFVPPGQVLPFRATERPAPAAPAAPVHRRASARPRPRVARKVAGALVLLALYVTVLWLILAPRGP